MGRWKALNLFCGCGGCGRGLQDADFDIVGAVDRDAVACAAFEYLTGVKPTCADLATMTPAELREACTERPHLVITSPPCVGHSGCLPEAMAQTPKYQALNSLALRGIWLALEAWDLPPPIIALENVPRITSRGAQWLEQIAGLLRGYGYALNMASHDCGKIGGLAQRRRRFLLLARHTKQVPAFIYQPPNKRVRGVGEVLGQLPVPLPGNSTAGPLHRLPRLSALNWVRLALIHAGGDWRDLPDAVAINPGPDRHRGGYGVGDWSDPSKTVVGASDPRNKPASVADPRLAESLHRHDGKYGVQGWNEAAHTVIGEARTGKGWSGVADPRLAPRGARQNGGFGVEGWTEPAHAVIAEGTVRNTHASVADPRIGSTQRSDSYGVNGWDDPASTVLAAETHDNSRASVADPRSGCVRREGAIGVTAWDRPSAPVIANGEIHNGPWQVADPRLDHQPRPDSYGVLGWAEPSHTIRAVQKLQNTSNTVADPRVPELFGPPIDLDDKRPLWVVIEAADGTWHRPMTTLELAALQGFPVWHRGAWLTLASGIHGEARKLIGNAIPPPAAEVVGRFCRDALEAAASGRFRLSNDDIWVLPQIVELQA